MADDTYSYCPVCDDWKPTKTTIRLHKKGILIRGYRYYVICKSCAKTLTTRRKKNA